MVVAVVGVVVEALLFVVSFIYLNVAKNFYSYFGTVLAHLRCLYFVKKGGERRGEERRGEDTDNPANQSKLELNTCNRREAQENMSERVTFGFDV